MYGSADTYSWGVGTNNAQKKSCTGGASSSSKGGNPSTGKRQGTSNNSFSKGGNPSIGKGQGISNKKGAKSKGAAQHNSHHQVAFVPTRRSNVQYIAGHELARLHLSTDPIPLKQWETELRDTYGENYPNLEFRVSKELVNILRRNLQMRVPQAFVSPDNGHLVFHLGGGFVSAEHVARKLYCSMTEHNRGKQGGSQTELPLDDIYRASRASKPGWTRRGRARVPPDVVQELLRRGAIGPGIQGTGIRHHGRREIYKPVPSGIWDIPFSPYVISCCSTDPNQRTTRRYPSLRRNPKQARPQ